MTYFFVLIAFFCNANFASATGDRKLSVNDLKQLQAQLPRWDAAEMNFDQKRESPLRKNRAPFKTVGTVRYAKDGKFIWSIQKPQQTLIFNGTDFFKITGSTGLQFSGASERARELRRIADVVINFNRLMEDYDIVGTPVSDGFLTTFSLRSKKSSGDLDLIAVGIDENAKYVKSVSLLFKDSAKSIFSFSQPRQTKLTPADFMPPKGVKISNAL